MLICNQRGVALVSQVEGICPLFDNLQSLKSTGVARVIEFATRARKICQQQSQSCILTGVSGSGKSATANLICRILIDSIDHRGKSTLIAQANMLFDAFGHVDNTPDNPNSSKFARLISLKIDEGAVFDCRIKPYLLDISWVTRGYSVGRATRGSGGNFHIFYQLLAGLTPALNDTLQLSSLEDYAILDYNGIDRASDKREFENSLAAAGLLKISGDEMHGLWKIIAAVLHFSQIEFEIEPGGDEENAPNAAINDPLPRAKGCSLLGLPDCGRYLSTGFLLTVRGREYAMPLTVQQAANRLETRIKGLYCKIFDWVTAKVNTALAVDEQGGDGDGGQFAGDGVIHVLDSFGFCRLEINSLQELCINYFNEKLQLLYDENLRQGEQGVGMDRELRPRASESTIELIEAPRTGIFGMLDEERQVPRGSGEGLIQKLCRDHHAHSHFKHADYPLVQKAGAAGEVPVTVTVDFTNGETSQCELTSLDYVRSIKALLSTQQGKATGDLLLYIADDTRAALFEDNTLRCPVCNKYHSADDDELLQCSEKLLQLRDEQSVSELMTYTASAATTELRLVAIEAVVGAERRTPKPWPLFTIVHYCGMVTYDANALFASTNELCRGYDAIDSIVREMADATTDALVREVLLTESTAFTPIRPERNAARGGRARQHRARRARFPGVCWVKQMKELVGILRATSVHFIPCVRAAGAHA
jgi:myosin heavy subunit